MPALEAHGFVGTFYVNPGRQADDGPRDRSQLSDEDYKEKWTRQIPGWQAAAARGHEVGNHTVDHPCSCNFDFGDSHLEDMSIDDIAHTIDVATRRLDALIPEQAGARRSFCYPCYQTFVGAGVEKQSYIPVVAERFLAARGGGPGNAGESGNNAARVDLAEVWGADVAGWSGAQLIEAVRQAEESGRWLVLVFHGVGGEHGLDVETEDFTQCEPFSPLRLSQPTRDPCSAS